MYMRRATLLAAVLAFQGCMCDWGQGDYSKGCDATLFSADDASYQPGDNCYAQGGTCLGVETPCPVSQQIASDCYGLSVCCMPAADASLDASTDQESEASTDARSDADASLEDGSGDTAMVEGGDGSVDASTVDATPGDATDAGSEPSGD